MARRRNRFISQAAEEALVRFGPELSALKELRRSAEMNLTQGVAAAHAGAAGVLSAINQARPDIRQAYGQAGAAAAQQAALSDADLAKLGPVAASVRAAILGERSGFQTRLAGEQAADLSSLSNRAVAAREGESFGTQQAQKSFINTLTQVLGRKQDLARERGAFTASTAQQLRQDAADRRLRVQLQEMSAGQSERNSLRSAGLDPNTGKPIQGGPLDPNAARYKSKAKGGRDGGQASDAAHAAAQDQVQTATSWAQRLKAQGLSRHDVAVALSQGRKESEVPVYRTDAAGHQQRVLNPDGTQQTRKRAGVPQIGSQLLLSAALDQAFDGHLSRQNARRLHQRGLQVRRLPVTSYTEWARRRRGNRTEAGIRSGRLAGPPSP